jgi:hypothetical protein
MRSYRSGRAPDPGSVLNTWKSSAGSRRRERRRKDGCLSSIVLLGGKRLNEGRKIIEEDEEEEREEGEEKQKMMVKKKKKMMMMNKKDKIPHATSLSPCFLHIPRSTLTSTSSLPTSSSPMLTATIHTQNYRCCYCCCCYGTRLPQGLGCLAGIWMDSTFWLRQASRTEVESIS